MRDERDVDQRTGSLPQGGDGLRLAFGIVGVVGVLAGLAAIVLPHATLFAVSWVFGIYLVVSGAALVVRGLRLRPGVWWRQVGLVVLGALVVAGGVVAIVFPPIGARWVALLLGFAWILEGIALVYAPWVGRRPLTVVLAVLSVLSGILVMNLPGLGALVTVAAVGSVLIVFGVVQLVVAFSWPSPEGERAGVPVPGP
jgi:uncharacterized membrane protein HdeD (DUF308 family)